MCTVSWWLTQNGYSIHFNRDEQKQRAVALVPKVLHVGDTRAAMPIDPDGGGTWCSTNEYGLSLALLNFYQGKFPKGRLVSRGKIVRECSRYRAFSEVGHYLNELNLNKYAPFSLLCFSISDEKVSVNMLRWNGKLLSQCEQASPLVSSAINYEQVSESRSAIYDQFVNPSTNIGFDDALFSLHSSHLPAKSSLSVCMHREDAQTVSYSHIRVTNKKVNFRYSNGAPCEVPPILYTSIRRLQ